MDPLPHVKISGSAFLIFSVRDVGKDDFQKYPIFQIRKKTVGVSGVKTRPCQRFTTQNKLPTRIRMWMWFFHISCSSCTSFQFEINCDMYYVFSVNYVIVEHISPFDWICSSWCRIPTLNTIILKNLIDPVHLKTRSSSIRSSKPQPQHIHPRQAPCQHPRRHLIFHPHQLPHTHQMDLYLAPQLST